MQRKTQTSLQLLAARLAARAGAVHVRDAAVRRTGRKRACKDTTSWLRTENNTPESEGKEFYGANLGLRIYQWFCWLLPLLYPFLVVPIWTITKHNSTVIICHFCTNTHHIESTLCGPIQIHWTVASKIVPTNRHSILFPNQIRLRAQRAFRVYPAYTKGSHQDLY